VAFDMGSVDMQTCGDLERIAATISFPRGVVGYGFKGVTAIELSTSPPGVPEDPSITVFP
jgi:hypothetical protein